MTDCLNVTGVFAQVVVACAAVYLAWRANSINHSNVFVGRAVDDLLQLRRSAVKVKGLYGALFEKFPSVAGKQKARAEWLRAREDVTIELHFLASAFPDVEKARAAWSLVEEQEDSHARSDAMTECSSKVKAVTDYEKVCASFYSEMAQCIRLMRSGGSKKK